MSLVSLYALLTSFDRLTSRKVRVTRAAVAAKSFGMATVMLHVLENIYIDLNVSRKEAMLKEMSVSSN